MKRLDSLERDYQWQRDAKIDRIAAFALRVLTPAEYDLVLAAFERGRRDGPYVQFTEAELAAAWRFAAFVQARPDILQLINELHDPY